jgi:hypothetical protein
MAGTRVDVARVMDCGYPGAIKAVLAAAKRRGVKLGGFRADAKLTVKARKSAYKARAANDAPVIRELQAAGITSLSRIAAALNERGIPTARGRGTWQAVQVSRVLSRL